MPYHDSVITCCYRERWHNGVWMLQSNLAVDSRHATKVIECTYLKDRSAKSNSRRHAIWFREPLMECSVFTKGIKMILTGSNNVCQWKSIELDRGNVRGSGGASYRQGRATIFVRALPLGQEAKKVKAPWSIVLLS